MRLFLYERFLESYTQLPKQIQKKVMDFIKKFKNDPTLHSIHLEPISSFKDPQMRTARIDQKYRAIIHAASSGEIYHLLWVDTHDEAMAWAGNKVFEWNQHTQVYQIYEHQEVVQAVLTGPAPVEKKTFFSQFPDEKLQQTGVPAPLLPSVKTIDNIEELEQMESYLPREAFESLFYLLDGIPIEQVLSEIEQGKEKSASFNEQLMSANNQRHFVQVEGDDTLVNLLQGDLRKWKIFLHPSQRAIVEKEYPGSFKVSGAAGTGKTVVALHRLKFLARRVAGKRVFFTTFTKSLVQNLRQQVSELDIPFDKIVLSNIHDFIVTRAKELRLVEPDHKILDFSSRDQIKQIWQQVVDQTLSEFDIDFLMREYQDVIMLHHIQTQEDYLRVSRVGLEVPLGHRDRIKVWEIITAFEALKKQQRAYYLDEIANKLATYYGQQPEKPFDHIIADEIQDFSDVELRLLRAMVTEKENDLFLVGDPLQKIYHRRLNFSRVGINIRGTRSKRLRVNYRTTEEIKRGAMSVIKDIAFEDFDGSSEERNGYISLLHGSRPLYETLNSTEEMNNYLLAWLQEATKEGLLQFTEICIAARTKNSVRDIKHLMHQHQLPHFDLGTQSGDRSGMVLSTFHNMKGLEFKQVVLYDVSQTTVPLKFHGYESLSAHKRKEYDQSERSLLYVAMSRAVQQLLILGVGHKSSYIKI